MKHFCNVFFDRANCSNGATQAPRSGSSELVVERKRERKPASVEDDKPHA